MRNNMSSKILKRRMSRFRKLPRRTGVNLGHSVKLIAPLPSWALSLAVPAWGAGETTTIIRICDVKFQWRPGQHVRICIPQLGRFEFHPFTPANCPENSFDTSVGDVLDTEGGHLLSSSDLPPSNEMVLMIRSRSGFTRRLAQYYSRWLSLPCPNSTQAPSSMRAFIDGPFGSPPSWENYESLLFVSKSRHV